MYFKPRVQKYYKSIVQSDKKNLGARRAQQNTFLDYDPQISHHSSKF